MLTWFGVALSVFMFGGGLYLICSGEVGGWALVITPIVTTGIFGIVTEVRKGSSIEKDG